MSVIAVVRLAILCIVLGAFVANGFWTSNRVQEGLRDPNATYWTSSLFRPERWRPECEPERRRLLRRHYVVGAATLILLVLLSAT